MKSKKNAPANEQKKNNENKNLNPEANSGNAKKIINEEDQNEVVNPRDLDFDKQQKQKSYEEGKKDNSVKINEDLDEDNLELPRDYDDSKKTIHESPKM
jgi:hypothetical protein